MDRRQFVHTASAVVASAMVPTYSLSMVLPDQTTTTDSLSVVFALIDEYQFHDINDRAALFGFAPHEFRSRDDLYSWVKIVTEAWPEHDHWQRLCALQQVHQLLIGRYGEGLSPRLAWLDTALPALDGNTPRHVMTTVRYGGLERVIMVLEASVV
jgi:hypothetical protein